MVEYNDYGEERALMIFLERTGWVIGCDEV